MRKLKLQMQVTVDGCVAGRRAIDWMFLMDAGLLDSEELLEVLLDETEERGLPVPPRPVDPRTDLHATLPVGKTGANR